MSQVFRHQPVMVEEVVALFEPVPPGLVVDATVGGGGHAAALLSANPHIQILGIDRDTEAVRAASSALAPWRARASVVHLRFDKITEAVGPGNRRGVSGVLFDLGVSSPQFDMAERGFSYWGDGPLDMRMDRSQVLTAAEVVNTYPPATLASMFTANGEGRFAKRIAEAIVAARPLSGTRELTEAVRDAIPAAVRRQRGHPARRVFQAIRIEVNTELELIAPAIDSAIELLVPGGRCVAISYHSGEDRLVKERFLLAATGGCSCPAGLPCVCGAEPRVRLLNKRARRPSGSERESNPRSESARLRAVERLRVDRQPGPGG